MWDVDEKNGSGGYPIQNFQISYRMKNVTGDTEPDTPQWPLIHISPERVSNTSHHQLSLCLLSPLPLSTVIIVLSQFFLSLSKKNVHLHLTRFLCVYLPQRQYEIFPLHPNFTYLIQIWATNKLGKGPSTTVECSTHSNPQEIGKRDTLFVLFSVRSRDELLLCMIYNSFMAYARVMCSLIYCYPCHTVHSRIKLSTGERKEEEKMQCCCCWSIL